MRSTTKGHTGKRRERFVRFVCDSPHPTVDAERGMFTVHETMDFSTQKGRVQKANEEAWYWFSANGAGRLYRPRLSGKARTRNVRKSLFWFREHKSREYGEVVRRARQLGEAMAMAGVEVREIKTTSPGRIIWEDFHQVLALPESTVPRAFTDTPAHIVSWPVRG